MGESVARVYNSSMKNLFIAIFAVLLMIGCGGEEDTVKDKPTAQEIVVQEVAPKDKETRLDAARESPPKESQTKAGTPIGGALDESINPFREPEARSRIVILLTDGKDDPPPQHSPLVLAEGAKEDGIKIYTIAVGQSTRTRTYVYDRRSGGLLRNSSGNPNVRVANYPVDKAILRKIAQTSGAKFFEAGDEAKLRRIYEEIISLEGQACDISLAVDLSASMLALDMSEGATQPVTRLDLVKRVIGDFVTNRENTRIGLIAFSTKPVLLNPLTNDKDRVMANLRRLRIGFISQTGTNIGGALAGSINCLLGSGAATANRDNFIYMRLLQENGAEETTAGAGLLVADEVLETALAKALKKTKDTIIASDLATLKSLDATNAKIRSLSGLEHAIRLNRLKLSGNRISNLTPLAKLTNLTEVTIYHNPVQYEQIAMLRKALPNCKIYFTETTDGKPFTETTDGKPFTIPDLSIEMLWVKPGTFEMGSPLGEAKRRDSETPHTVTLSRGFYLGKHEVTQAQWQKVMGSNPSFFKGADCRVERVSWTDVTSFCDKLTELERKAGRLPAGMSYQLPTEAQWEYACRAGTKTAFSFGNSLTSRQANIPGGLGKTTDVGNYPANAWGFHDMHGNVWEWCADWYGDYPTGAARDPAGPADDFYRVYRGGSWLSTADFARSALRRSNVPARSRNTLGFRPSLRPLASK